MSWTWWLYPKRRFRVGDRQFTVRMWAQNDGLKSRLENEAGETLAKDATPLFGPDAIRNHRLAFELEDGRALSVEAGYVSSWRTGIAVRVGDELVYQSHPDRTIAYPDKYRETAITTPGGTLSGAVKEGFKEGLQESDVDFSVLKRNRTPIAVDILMAITFFMVARLTDLQTAAITGAILGLLLLVVQRFVPYNLLGGLALFGVVMALFSAGLAFLLEDDTAIKLRNALLGLIGAALFLGDGLFLEGRKLGRRMMCYVPYNDLNPARLAIAISGLGTALAVVSASVALFASTEVWLYYNLFGDFLLAVLLFQFVLAYARRSGKGEHQR